MNVNKKLTVQRSEPIVSRKKVSFENCAKAIEKNCKLVNSIYKAVFQKTVISTGCGLITGYITDQGFDFYEVCNTDSVIFLYIL